MHPATSVPPVTAPDEHDAEDRALLAAHLTGDPDAFDNLVRRHRQRMWAVALRTLGEPEEAADAVQDACLSAFRAAGSYRGDARVTTWLHRIVVNACLDRVRRKAVRPTVPMPPEPPADPRDRLAERETSLEVERALADLPDDQRLAIVLVDLHGLSVEEAATMLGVPGGTVKSRCFRGRARLAVSLSFLRGDVASRGDQPHPRNPTGGGTVPPVTPHAQPEGGPT